MIDTIVFDLEGVIIDTEPLWDNANRQLLERHGVRYDRAAIKPLIAGKSLAEGTAIMQEKLRLGGELSALVAERMGIIEEQLRAGSTFIPGFREFYAGVRDSYKSCIATSMDRRLLGIVDRQLGLSKLFGGNLFSIADVEHRSKPDPAIFLYAARKIGSRADQCVVLEDSPKGIQAAKNAGMACIAVAFTFDQELLAEADLIVHSFAEIDLSRL